MGLYVRRNQEQSDLQDQITKNLRDKHKTQFERDNNPELAKQTDLTENYKQNTKATSPLMAVWVILLVAILAAAVWAIFATA